MNFDEIRNKIKKDENEPPFDRFMRKISVYVTYVVSKTNLTPNQLSTIMIIIGLLSGAAFFWDKLILGVILMQLWYLIDFVDGEIARLKDKTSYTGWYFDHLIHYINHPIYYITISYAVYRHTNGISVIIFGILGAFFDVIDRASIDTYKMVLYNTLMKTGVKQEEKSKVAPMKKKLPLEETLVNLLHFPDVMNMFSISIIIDEILIRMGTIDNIIITKIVIISYGICIPAYNILRMVYQIKTFKVDREIEYKRL